MTSIPPHLDDGVALVAVWPVRPDTPTQIAESVAVLLRAIEVLEPAITGWRRNRAKAVATSDDIPGLADLIERGAVKDSQRPPVHMKAAGYVQALYPVGIRGVRVQIAAGQVTDKPVVSTCAVQVQTIAPAVLYTAEAAYSLITAAVDAFRPRWAAWTRGPLGDQAVVPGDGSTFEWFRYGPTHQMRALDANAVDYGDGAIARLDDPHITDATFVLQHLDSVREEHGGR